MTMKRIGFMICAVICLSSLVLAARAQEMAGETKSEVPELVAFHDVIYPIWHTAYPAKDFAMLRSYVAEIHKLAAPIYAAKLPGILREKEVQWKAGLALLKKAVDDYSAAASGKDDQALLVAAENLHAKYEALVRALAPVLKEMDAFHQVLYVVYHKYLTDKAYDKIRSVTADLVTKAEAITKSTLPKKLEAKGDAFQKAATELLTAAKQLDASGQAHDHAGMEKGVEDVHAKYQALEKLFN